MEYKQSFYDKYIKRSIDFIVALFAVIILSPILIIVAILVRIKLGSPVIFKQDRPGLNEEIFTMYKFRTMTDERNSKGELLPDEIRLTKFGKTLRSTSLDELPELFNIIKGDMAIVGPRPQLVRDLVFMSHNQKKRQLVRPGLTGWAQINGRNSIAWERKLQYDIEYLDMITFRKDVFICLKTVVSVIRSEGISSDNMETAEDFGDYLLRTHSIDRNEYEKKQSYAKELLR